LKKNYSQILREILDRSTNLIRTLENSVQWMVTHKKKLWPDISDPIIAKNTFRSTYTVSAYPIPSVDIPG
jgi:hypothetical protein